jgi:4-amino-4-deoxy-L-arabinose transferase-like glycosyltransferase
MTDQKDQILKNLVLLLIAVVPFFSLGLSNHGLWTADEPRVAEIGREMALDGNWAVPTLNQKPFLEHPPLYYVLLGYTFKALGGASDKVARIPSALFGFAGVIVVFFIANFLFGPRVALLSGIILTTTAEYFQVSHWVIVDSALTFFVICTMGLFIKGYLSEDEKTKLSCYLLLYVSSTLAFLTKGFIGIVMPGLSIMIFLILDKNLKEILRMRLWLGVLIFIILAFPWFIALWHQGGAGSLNDYLIPNQLQRFLPTRMTWGTSEIFLGHRHPFYYYLHQFPAVFLPWSILLVPVLYHAFSKRRQSQGRADKGLLLAKCWFFVVFILLSIASTKRALYLLPIFAPFAMITALYMDNTLGSQPLNKIGKVFVWILNIVLLVISLELAPTYFYIKKSYLLNLPPTVFVSIVATSILVTALSLAAIRYLLRRNMRRYWISVHISILLTFLCFILSVVPVLDLSKSFVPFCRQMMTVVPADQPLYAYQPDETLMGAVPFYTGRYLLEVENLEQVSTLLQKNEFVFIVIRDARARQEKELLSAGKLHILVKQEMEVGRTLLLLSNKDQAALTLPAPFKKRLRRWGTPHVGEITIIILSEIFPKVKKS